MKKTKAENCIEMSSDKGIKWQTGTAGQCHCVTMNKNNAQGNVKWTSKGSNNARKRHIHWLP